MSAKLKNITFDQLNYSKDSPPLVPSKEHNKFFFFCFYIFMEAYDEPEPKGT